jgi:Zn finger protein HypA/HybF involved in hydrogenase expression
MDVLRSQIATLQSQLTILLVSVKAARDQLSQLQTLTVQEQLQRQTADVFFKLLSDPSAVTDAQLQRFMEQIMTVCLSGKLTVGLPIDYTKLREEMVFLVEAVLGKRFVSRETHEAEVKALRDQNSDLLLGGISTLKKEHAKVRKMKSELAESSAEEIISALAEQDFDLKITVFKCPECHALGSCYRPPGTKTAKLTCPACASDNLKILSKMSTSTHNKTDQNTRTSEPQIEQITPQINHK